MIIFRFRMSQRKILKKQSKAPNLYQYLGNAHDLSSAELPTLQRALQYGLFLRERSVTEISIRQMCQSISARLREIWRSVNPSLPIVTDALLAN